MKADLELVEEVKAGDQRSFAELVRRHQSGLLRVCARMTKDEETAEDVVQESFVKAYRKINTFEGRSSFKSWLYQIALNTARNRLRANRFETVNIDDVQISSNATAEHILTGIDVRAILKVEVDKLPEKQRVALELRVYEDLSFQEIAQIMDCPYDTAKANYRHGLLKIKKALEGNNMLKEWLGEGIDFFAEIENKVLEV